MKIELVLNQLRQFAQHRTQVNGMGYQFKGFSLKSNNLIQEAKIKWPGCAVGSFPLDAWKNILLIKLSRLFNNSTEQEKFIEALIHPKPFHPCIFGVRISQLFAICY